MLLGSHGCGAQYAASLFKSGAELAVAAEPSKWVFFPESYGTETYKDIVKKNYYGEIVVFERIANVLNIKRENPLVYEPSHSKIIDAVEKKGTNKDIIIGALSFADIARALIMHYGRIPDGREFAQALSQIYSVSEPKRKWALKELNRIIQGMLKSKGDVTIMALANKFSMTEEQIKGCLRIFLRQHPIHNLQAQKKAKEIYDELGKTSNELNASTLAQSVREHSRAGRKKALYIMGQNHAPLVQDVYNK